MFLELVRSTPRADKVATEAARDQAELRPIHARCEWKALTDPDSHGNAISNPWAGAIADTANLAPVPSEYRMKVLHGANPAVAAHILVSLATKVVGDAFDNLFCQADSRRRLEEGQPF
jgi:hypothetical protein